MRSARELKKLIDDAIPITGGKMELEIIAVDDEEAETLRGMLKGRHGAKSISVRVAKPSELQPNFHWR